MANFSLLFKAEHTFTSPEVLQEVLCGVKNVVVEGSKLHTLSKNKLSRSSIDLLSKNTSVLESSKFDLHLSIVLPSFLLKLASGHKGTLVCDHIPEMKCP